MASEHDFDGDALALGHSLLADVKRWTGFLRGDCPPPLESPDDWWPEVQKMKARLQQVKDGLREDFGYHHRGVEKDEVADPLGFLQCAELYLGYSLHFVRAIDQERARSSSATKQ